MQEESTKLDFFLGSNTPYGFVSLFDEITGLYNDYRSFVIKGGAGTGKSTLMKKIAKASSDSYLEHIHCSSDPNSLDAVILPQSKITVLDGTPPHVVEPMYPGAYETVVNLCDCWDEEKLQKNRSKIITISQKISGCHKQCVGLLKAMQSLLEDNYSLSLQNTDKDKIKKTVKNIFEREAKHVKGILSCEKRRFLNTVTPKGLVCYTDTINTLCNKIYLLKDPYGASSELFMEEMREKLLEKNFEIYTCLSPFTLKPEHIIIPELKLCFVTSTPFLPLENILTPYRIIHFTRFTKSDELKKKKQRMKFNLRMASELLNESIFAVRKAKTIHDILEEFYKDAIDYDKVNAISESIIKRITQTKGSH